VPTDEIEHPTGATDVVLRFDAGPDYSFGDLTGILFMPGPEFTLYGDGTVIVRDDRAAPPSPDGPVFRGQPFRIGHLDEGQIQSLLRFALVDGGLQDARDRYETPDVDSFGYSIFQLRAGGLDKRVAIVGSTSPFDSLADKLRHVDREADIATQAFMSDRYWGVLLNAQMWLDGGHLPAVPSAGSAPWPWAGIGTANFAYRNDRYYVLDGEPVDPMTPGDNRRVMSADEAAVLGLSNDGGVVQGIHLLGPDRKVYWFSLWPMLPDEPG